MICVYLKLACHPNHFKLIAEGSICYKLPLCFFKGASFQRQWHIPCLGSGHRHTLRRYLTGVLREASTPSPTVLATRTPPVLQQQPEGLHCWTEGTALQNHEKPQALAAPELLCSHQSRKAWPAEPQLQRSITRRHGVGLQLYRWILKQGQADHAHGPQTGWPPTQGTPILSALQLTSRLSSQETRQNALPQLVGTPECLVGLQLGLASTGLQVCLQHHHFTFMHSGHQPTASF